MIDSVKAEIYDPFSRGGQAYLGSADVEIGFAGKKRTEVPYDQDELGAAVARVSVIRIVWAAVFLTSQRRSKIKSLHRGKKS